jgi:hypothetical protein
MQTLSGSFPAASFPGQDAPSRFGRQRAFAEIRPPGQDFRPATIPHAGRRRAKRSPSGGCAVLGRLSLRTYIRVPKFQKDAPDRSGTSWVPS